jgi:hypothetical protein
MMLSVAQQKMFVDGEFVDAPRARRWRCSTRRPAR